MSSDETDDQAVIGGLSDEQLLDLARVALVMPWQDDEKTTVDADGYAPVNHNEDEDFRSKLQQLCWKKFHSNPQVNTSVRGLVGRLVGNGFEVSSSVPQIQDVIDEETFDLRNRLYHFLPKNVTRAYIEGEWYSCFTVHTNGFVEIDFVDPAVITGGGTEDGVIYHPTKSWMPLVYQINDGENQMQIPSIYLARWPEMLDLIDNSTSGLDKRLLKKSKAFGLGMRKYVKIGGFKKFIVAWNKGLARRQPGYLQTTLEWLNHYENLKKYEIDHKKSSGAYAWVFTFEDMKAWKLWLGLSDSDRAKTAIMAKKTPGGSLILPPGIKCDLKSPNLPKISDTDTDILHMVTSGLNEPEDVSTGQSKGTFASVKASRGPMSDRTSDEMEFFRRFYLYDFWGAIFFLRSKVGNFPEMFSVKEAVGWKKKKEPGPDGEEKKEPIFRNKKKTPEHLLEITFPTSEVVDYEGRAKAFLGVKHGSTHDVLGLPHSVIAGKLGQGNYRKLRLQAATEDDQFPKLTFNIDQEAMQEKKEAEPGKGKNGKNDNDK